MGSDSDDPEATESVAKIVQQRIVRRRAGAARRSVLIAMRELRRAFAEIRAHFPGAGPELDSEEAIAEGAVLAAGPDPELALARVRREEAAARHRRMMVMGVAGVGLAVAAGVVHNQRRSSTRQRPRTPPHDGLE